MTPRREPSSEYKPTARQDPLFNGTNTWRGKLSAVWQSFSQYGWDLLGILLLAFALIFLLGFFNITSGVLVSTITRLLTIAMGLGRFLLVIVLITFALQVIRWRKHPLGRIDLSKILGFEFAFFLFLGVLSLAKGGGASEARAGLDPGGVIGWGIAEVFRLAFGPTAGFVLLAACLCISLIVAFRVLPRLERFVRTHLNRMVARSGEDFEKVDPPSPAVVAEPDEQEKSPVQPPKKQVWLPPEFRKSFETSSKADEKPESPLERPEGLPPLSLLQRGNTLKPDTRSINMSAGLIEKTLDEFGIPAKVVGYRTGPTVTQFAVEPGYIDKSDDERHKIRVSQISSLQRDLALALSAERLRIEAPVPGKSYVGIEIPNSKSSNVHLRPLMESEAFSRVNSPLALALGRDVSGRPVVTDLASMPHLLIAGTTGSGKSVCITALTPWARKGRPISGCKNNISPRPNKVSAPLVSKITLESIDVATV